MALNASVYYRSCPMMAGGGGGGEGKRSEVDESTCARSIDRGALRSRDPQHAVKAKNKNTRLNSKRYFNVLPYAACKPEITR